MLDKTKKAAAAVGAALCLAGAAWGAGTAPSEQQWRDARAAAAGLAAELAGLCPLATPGDQAAFDACRRGMYGDSLLRSQLHTIVLWGRQRDPNAALSATSLTQFAPDVLTG